ncbi:hypothetical protein [Amycolatopsis sp. NPDC098790]|uniref:methylation-associated defense system ATP-binding protein MAD8 n=1 Tax=Amycolatopsis sp. NPDC098790 TaxID=3363939 RepID=UPI0037FA24CA
MTTTGLREVADADLDDALEGVLFPRLLSLLASRQPGHCVRVTALPAALAARLCGRLRAATSASAQIHVLGTPPVVPAELAVTGTKLVELRNPAADGRQRPPLLVFIPPSTHASAEDSFGVATFEQADLGDVYRDLADRLHAALPAELRSGVDEVFDVLAHDAAEPGAPIAGSLEQARYLLTLRLNNHNRDVAGAAVFELGLVPDFELFTDPTQVRTRAARNARQVRVLTRADHTPRQRVVELHLTDPAFRSRLAAFLVASDLDNPRDWARRIVVDHTNWGLSFHRWPLPEDRTAQPIHIAVTDIDLPYAGDHAAHADHNILGAIIGQRYLIAGRTGLTQVSTTFTVDPAPEEISGLATFRVELMSEESGPTGVWATVKASSRTRRGYRARLTKLRTAVLDDGWHYLRVEPLDATGVPLPVMLFADDETRRRNSDDGVHPDNETARFFVLADDDDLDEAPPRARVLRNVGVTQELMRQRYEALAERREWTDIECKHLSWKEPGRVVEAGFGGRGAVEIPLSPVLVQLERSILANPERLAPYQVDIVPGMQAQVRDSGTGASESDAMREDVRAVRVVGADAGEELRTFLRARAAVFSAVRGRDEMVLAGRDIAGLRTLALAYAEAYAELLTQQMRQAERAGAPDLLRQVAPLLQIDSVTVDQVDIRGHHYRVTLLAPTHPLRLLWLVTWAELGHRWLVDAAGADRAVVVAAHRTLLTLRPAGFPLVVPADDGTLSVSAADLTPYWAAYLPTDTGDPHTLLTEVTAALAIPDRGSAELSVSPAQMADRLERYVRMHPYVHTLVICAVNAGRADLIAGALVALQRRKELQHLTYDVRLFAADPHQPDAGQALADLLTGQWSTVAEAEIFATPAAAGGTPKLSVAVLPLDDFSSATSGHNAHVTVLFDAFSGERAEVGALPSAAPAPVHGLVQQMTVNYVENGGAVAWHKRPRHGTGRDLPGAEECSDLLSRLPAVMSAAAAAVTTGEVGTGQVPQVTLSLTPSDGALLFQAHQCSDWVITVDRTLGVEYFDNPASSRHAAYIIDVAPGTVEGLTHHLVVSSRSVDELQALLAPVTDQHGLRIEDRHVRTFFDQLRLLSGSLAFKIASAAPNQRTEVLGLSLARLYLQYQDVLADQVLVPLDAHLELYRDARRRANEIAESVGLRRTDLALFTLNAAQKTITCRLIEVKCVGSLSGLGDVQRLRDTITAQLDGSAAVLAENFDPAATANDRPDRSVRNAELATLLRFYVGRAVRHGIMTTAAAAEASWLLDHLDWGFQFDITRTGLIFDLGSAGTEQFSEDGVEFHRIGRDLIEQLLDAIPTEFPFAEGQTTHTATSAALAASDLTLPRLSDVAFRAPVRPHTIPDEHRISPQNRDGDRGADTVAEPGPEDRAAESAQNAMTATRGEQVHEDRSSSKPTVPGQEGRQRSTQQPMTVDVVSRDSSATSDTPAWRPDIYLGTTGESPQYGVLGECSGKRVALDLNETHTISLFGVQGGGKSYTLGSIIEAAALPAAPVNVLTRPLATIVFHYSPTLDYAPEFTSMTAPNSDEQQVQQLRERYGVQPNALTDVVMLVPEDQIDQRIDEYPDIEIRPLKFGSQDLRIEHWQFLMGAVGNQSTYIRQLKRIVRANRRDLSLAVIRQGIDESAMADHIKQLAQDRLDLAADYIDDSVRITDIVRPGRVIIVDLRDELIAKDEALGLFVVLMQLFAEATAGGQRFNKLVVFDEAHKYIDSADLVDGLVESVREMRHKGMSILVASQDPPSVPISLIELSNHIILHKFNSPAWLKHLQKANAALADLSPAKMTALRPGEAYIWSSKASDLAFTHSAIKVQLRPRITRHGGGTKTAMDS